MKTVVQLINLDLNSNTMLFRVPKDMLFNLSETVFKTSKEKHNGYVSLDIRQPAKPRTTGKNSQNSCIWGYATQLANYTGQDVEDIIDYIKLKAIKRGYPYHINQLNGHMTPESMTNINTVQAGYLIEELELLANELEFTLYEGE